MKNEKVKKVTKKHKSRDEKLIDLLTIYVADQTILSKQIIESEIKHHLMVARKLSDKEPLLFGRKQWKKDFDAEVNHIALLKNVLSKKESSLNELFKKIGGLYGHH